MCRKVLLTTKNMNKQQEQLETLREIRSLMEQSSRFLSLSGLSGVVAGLAAIAGVTAVYFFLDIPLFEPGYYRLATDEFGAPKPGFFKTLLGSAAVVLAIALIAAGWLASRKAKKAGLPFWDATAKRMLGNLLLPLAMGGIFCMILLLQGLVALVPPATMLFYGLAMVNASKYTLNDIRFLGISVIITGLVATAVPDYGLLFWGFGFGVLHIVYGIAMHFKYER